MRLERQPGGTTNERTGLNSDLQCWRASPKLHRRLLGAGAAPKGSSSAAAAAATNLRKTTSANTIACPLRPKGGLEEQSSGGGEKNARPARPAASCGPNRLWRSEGAQTLMAPAPPPQTTTTTTTSCQLSAAAAGSVRVPRVWGPRSAPREGARVRLQRRQVRPSVAWGRRWSRLGARGGGERRGLPSVGGCSAASS